MIFLSGLLLIAIFNSSCDNTDAQDNTITITTADSTDDNIDTVYSVDSAGREMKMLFDNQKNTVAIHLDNTDILLNGQPAASGIWYTNKHYELNGKGNDYQLLKDGKVIFTHEDDKVRSLATNKQGDTLRMVFNNTTNTAKLYLNDEPEINLTGQRTGSGIRYTNKDYELIGKGKTVELRRAGKTIFRN